MTTHCSVPNLDCPRISCNSTNSNNSALVHVCHCSGADALYHHFNVPPHYLTHLHGIIPIQNKECLHEAQHHKACCHRSLWPTNPNTLTHLASYHSLKHFSTQNLNPLPAPTSGALACHLVPHCPLCPEPCPIIGVPFTNPDSFCQIAGIVLPIPTHPPKKLLPTATLTIKEEPSMYCLPRQSLTH